MISLDHVIWCRRCCRSRVIGVLDFGAVLLTALPLLPLLMLLLVTCIIQQVRSPQYPAASAAAARKKFNNGACPVAVSDFGSED